MKVHLVCVRDDGVGAFMMPAFVAAVSGAVRAFGDQVNTADSAYAKHPEDYSLWELGTWEDDTGLFETGVPRLVTRAKDLVRG